MNITEHQLLKTVSKIVDQFSIDAASANDDDSYQSLCRKDLIAFGKLQGIHILMGSFHPEIGSVFDLILTAQQQIDDLRVDARNRIFKPLADVGRSSTQSAEVVE